MPPNPPSKPNGFVMRSMSLRDMQISKPEKKILGPPSQILATPLRSLMNNFVNELKDLNIYDQLDKQLSSDPTQ